MKKMMMTALAAVVMVFSAACGLENDVSGAADGGVVCPVGTHEADNGVCVVDAAEPDDSASVDDDVDVTCEAECPQGTVMTRLVCTADGSSSVEVECTPVAPPPVVRPPSTQPPVGATVTVVQDANSVRLSLSGDYRNLGAWQAEGGHPLAAGTDLSVCALAPSSAATGWDGEMVEGSATSSMNGDTAVVEWSEAPASIHNCVLVEDGEQVSTAQVVFTFRALCPSGQIYWPDLGAWNRVGAPFVYWTDDGVWRGGLCRAGIEGL